MTDAPLVPATAKIYHNIIISYQNGWSAAPESPQWVFGMTPGACIALSVNFILLVVVFVLYVKHDHSKDAKFTKYASDGDYGESATLKMVQSEEKRKAGREETSSSDEDDNDNDDFYEWIVVQKTIRPITCSEGDFEATDPLHIRFLHIAKHFVFVLVVAALFVRLDRIFDMNHMRKHWKFCLGQLVLVSLLIGWCLAAQISASVWPPTASTNSDMPEFFQYVRNLSCPAYWCIAFFFTASYPAILFIMMHPRGLGPRFRRNKSQGGVGKANWLRIHDVVITFAFAMPFIGVWAITQLPGEGDFKLYQTVPVEHYEGPLAWVETTSTSASGETTLHNSEAHVDVLNYIEANRMHLILIRETALAIANICLFVQVMARFLSLYVTGYHNYFCYDLAMDMPNAYFLQTGIYHYFKSPMYTLCRIAWITLALLKFYQTNYIGLGVVLLALLDLVSINTYDYMVEQPFVRRMYMGEKDPDLSEYSGDETGGEN